jgi:hypothetical protein
MMDHSERQVKHLKHIKYSRIFPLHKESLHPFRRKKLAATQADGQVGIWETITRKQKGPDQKPIGVLTTIGSTMPSDINSKETASPKALIVVM